MSKKRKVQKDPESPPEYKWYKKFQLVKMTPWKPGFDMNGVSVSEADQRNGSPHLGDMIAVNPVDSTDCYLVSHEYFQSHYEEVV